MHPRFQSLFVHPKKHKPLIFFGSVDGSDGIPVLVFSPTEKWPEEFLKLLEEIKEAEKIFLGSYREESWIGRKWINGYLYAYGEPEMYPVIDGIPIFSQKDTWPSFNLLKHLREVHALESSWEFRSKDPALREFAKRIAERGSLMLDIATGPQGGFVPLVLQINPEAMILMNDLGLGLLQEWEKFLKGKNTPNVSLAQFDIKEMPIKSDSIDIVSEVGGLLEVGSMESVREVYRVLKPGGILFSVNSMVDKDEFKKLPAEVRTRWYRETPLSIEGFSDAFKQAGFKVVSHILLGESEVPPDQSVRAHEAARYGAKLRLRNYRTEAIK